MPTYIALRVITDGLIRCIWQRQGRQRRSLFKPDPKSFWQRCGRRCLGQAGQESKYQNGSEHLERIAKKRGENGQRRCTDGGAHLLRTPSSFYIPQKEKALSQAIPRTSQFLSPDGKPRGIYSSSALLPWIRHVPQRVPRYVPRKSGRVSIEEEGRRKEITLLASPCCPQNIAYPYWGRPWSRTLPADLARGSEAAHLVYKCTAQVVGAGKTAHTAAWREDAEDGQARDGWSPGVSWRTSLGMRRALRELSRRVEQSVVEQARRVRTIAVSPPMATQCVPPESQPTCVSLRGMGESGRWRAGQEVKGRTHAAVFWENAGSQAGSKSDKASDQAGRGSFPGWLTPMLRAPTALRIEAWAEWRWNWGRGGNEGNGEGRIRSGNRCEVNAPIRALLGVNRGLGRDPGRVVDVDIDIDNLRNAVDGRCTPRPSVDLPKCLSFVLVPDWSCGIMQEPNSNHTDRPRFVHHSSLLGSLLCSGVDTSLLQHQFGRHRYRHRQPT